MIEHFKRLFSQTVIYGLGDAIIKAIAFFLIPLYTRVLTKEEVGIIALINIIELILLLVLSLSLNSAVLKVFHDYKTEAEKRAIFSTALIFISTIALFVLSLLFFNAEAVSKIFFKTTNYSVYLKFVFGSVFFNLFRLFGLAYLRSLEKPVHYSILNIVHFTFLVSFNIYHILILKQSILGVVKSSLFTAAILFVVVLTTVFKKVGFSFSKDALKKLIHFGMPIVPGTVAGWALTVSDRYLLNLFATPADVGLYDISYKFGMILHMILVMPFRTAWLPFVFSIRNDENANNIYSVSLTYFLLAATLIFLLISLFAKEIIVLVSTSAYLPGAKAIPLVALAYIFYGIYYIVDIGVLLKVKTIYYTIITGIGAAVNIGLNIVMIPKIGMIAAAINTAIAYFLIMTLMYFISKKLYPVSYEKKRLLKIFSLGCVIFIIGYTVSFESTLINVTFKILVIICYPVGLYLMKFFRSTEIAAGKKIIMFSRKEPYDTLE
ncbi:oligosaccharide flippase family protein [candidate division KSB1 bacterium]|nr:oligosaccharide flippase family protein [candidate division KSB1 bacterium]MBL7095082.1 oligosaccharide flippase family protein [candidate division KSB1 bacterium]